MEFIKESNRIFAMGDEGKVIAEITFPNVDDNTYVIDHTFVDESLRGLGIASQLMQMAVDQISSQGGNIQATCQYAVKWLKNKNLKG